MLMKNKLSEVNMLKSSILTSLELLADKKKNAATGTHPDSTPTPGSSPELPRPTSSPSGSGEAAAPAGKTGTGETSGLPEIAPLRRDELFRLNNGYYDRADRMSESAESGASGRSGKTKSSSPVVKPADQVKTGTLVMTTDSGKSGVSSNGLVYDPKTGQSVPGDRTPAITQTNDPAQGIPDEYADLAEIVAALPDEFDLTDWDEKTTREQRKALENSGLSAEEQMALLSAGMSVETIATIQDIQANHTVYGLTQAKADSVSNELLQIAAARADVQSHKVPLFSTPQLMRTFLTDLDKKEADLLASFGYGIVAGGKTGASAGTRPELPALLGDDSSGVALLYEGGNIADIADGFFESLSQIDQIQQDIADGTITFGSPAQKQQYLDYLDNIASTSETIYRRQLTEYIDGARLTIFDTENFKQLVNDLSVEQLRVLTDEIELKGLRKLEKNKNFEELMRTLLSDKASALQLVADDNESPICPRIWNGAEIAEEEGICVSGYYYENGKYYMDVDFGNPESAKFCLGTTKPSEVAIEIVRSTFADKAEDQTALGFKVLSKTEHVIDIIYYGIVLSLGLYPLMAFAPSDINAVQEVAAKIDENRDFTSHVDDATIFLRGTITHGGNGEEAYRKDYFNYEYNRK